jgi:hypothetical protein
LHQKDLWEIASRKLLPPEDEFRKIVVPQWGIFEHCYSWRRTNWWTWNNFPKYCWLFVASCNTCINSKICMGQSLCNIWKKTCWR